MQILDFDSRILSKTVLVYSLKHENLLLNLNLALDSKVYSVDENLTLREYYSVDCISIAIKIIGQLNQRRKIDFIWSRRSNLSELKIKVAFAQAPPYLMVNQKGNRTVFEGVFGGVFQLLQQRLGFKYSLVEGQSGQVGFLQKDNTSLIHHWVKLN